MLTVLALTLIITLNIQSADQCDNNWKEVKFDNGVSVKEHIAKEDTRTYKELQYSFTSTSGTHYNPRIKIYLYEDNLLNLETKKVEIIERKPTPILCVFVERKVKGFDGTTCITTPALITVEADYQKPGPFKVTIIPSKNLFDKALNKILNQPYNGSVHIYKAHFFHIMDDFYEYLITMTAKKNIRI